MEEAFSRTFWLRKQWSVKKRVSIENDIKKRVHLFIISINGQIKNVPSNLSKRQKKDVTIMALTYIQKTVHPAPISLHESDGVAYFTFPLLEQTGIVRHAFSTRLGGASKGYFGTMNFSLTRGDDRDDVLENYRRMAHILGVDVSKMVLSHQTHTTNIRLVTEEDAGKGIWQERNYENIDGLITNVPGLTLVTFFADCVPLYFVDPVHHAIGLSHSGWKGTVHRMGQKTIEAMGEAFGTKPEELRVCIGPSICRDCYEVSEDVADEFKREFGTESCQDISSVPYSLSDKTMAGSQTDSAQFYPWNGKSILMKKGKGKYQLDLWGANRRVLLDAGILPEHLAITNVCTKCNPDLLYSHRVMGDRRGNLAAFLALK